MIVVGGGVRDEWSTTRQYCSTEGTSRMDTAKIQAASFAICGFTEASMIPQ